MRRFFASSFVASALVIAACGGSGGNNDLFANDKPDEGDGSTPTNDSGITIPNPDSSVSDTGVVDSVVHEKDAPECHDLELRGDPVTATANPSPPPQTSPLTSLTPGLYGMKSIIDYSSFVAEPGSSRTTVFFTATKQYYITENSSGDTAPRRLTLSWKLSGGKLSRTILCGPGNGDVVEYRIDTSANGFTVYVPISGGAGNRTSAVRYERLD
jgi:hypothetical protein